MCNGLASQDNLHLYGPLAWCRLSILGTRAVFTFGTSRKGTYLRKALIRDRALIRHSAHFSFVKQLNVQAKLEEGIIDVKELCNHISGHSSLET